MKTGTISVYPDVRASGNLGELVLAPWQYMQHFRATLCEDGRLLVWMNGGILDVIEDRYVAISDGHRCEWHRIAGSSDTEGETGMATVCRTPPSWPDSKRWLLAWSGSYRRDPMTRPYRVWVGLATAPEPTGPWTCHSEAIRSQHLVVTPPPPNDWWPPGMWASSLVVKDGRVFLLTMDTGVPFPHARPRSALWEIMPDLSAQVVGGVKLADEVPRSWIFDVALRSDGALVCLTGGSSHDIDSFSVAEYAVPEWNPDAVCLASRTNRTFMLDGDPLPSDPGYVRTPEGGLVEPTTLLADWTTGVDPTARDWRGGWASEHDEVARLLSVVPARPRLLPQGAVWEVPYLDHHDPQFSVVTYDGDSVTVEWHGMTINVPWDLPAEDRVTRDGRTTSLVYLPSTFPDYMNPEWAKQRDEGRNFSVVTVRGKCMVYCYAPDSGSDCARLVQWRW